MGNPPEPTGAPPAPPRRLPLFLLGVALFVLGIAAYFVQLQLKQFVTPWYVPLLATAGVALMALSLWRRWGILRAALLVPFVLVCGLEWFFFLVAARVPDYTGPAQPGRSVPAFATTLADGRPFTDADLAKGDRSILVFFRGRW